MIRCNLAVLLAEQNLKITKVALDTGISRNTLHMLTSSRSLGIQLDTMNTLCLYLRITPDKLFSFFPADMNVIDVKKVLEKSNEAIYLITIETYEHRQYFKNSVLGTLKKISADEETYVLKMDGYIDKSIDLSGFELFTSKIDLENYFKRIPQPFINDLENNIIDRISLESDNDGSYDKDSFIIEWDLSELPF